MKYKELEILCRKQIPMVPKKPLTFLQIANQPHYENVISNILAFYFNIDEEHNLKDLFILSLLECINIRLIEKGFDKFETSENFDVYTEFLTTNGGKIDILLNNSERAIIIENKIYHYLNNDLEDYYKTIKLKPNQKLGIVLSLKRIKTLSHSRFINITHKKFLDTVFKNIRPYILHANDKYLIYLKDFYQNILNLTESNMELKHIQFFENNKKAITEAIDLQTAIKRHIISEVEKAGNLIENVYVSSLKSGSSIEQRARYYNHKIKENLMYVIVFDEVLSKNKLFIGVELKNSLLADRNSYKEIIFSDTEYEFISNANFYTDTKTDWSHFAFRLYEDLSSDNIYNLSEFIYSKINNQPLESIFNKIAKHLM